MGGFLRGLGACGARGRFAEKNLDSDDHFDRSFSFMTMKDKPRKQKKQKQLKERTK
jgi:hypothetical protein